MEVKNEKLQAVRGHQEAGCLQGGALPEHVECSDKVDLPSFAEGWVQKPWRIDWSVLRSGEVPLENDQGNLGRILRNRTVPEIQGWAPCLGDWIQVGMPSLGDRREGQHG